MFFEFTLGLIYLLLAGMAGAAVSACFIAKEDVFIWLKDFFDVQVMVIQLRHACEKMNATQTQLEETRAQYERLLQGENPN